jgi:KipI family sensor histidine kinase inhibitor
MPDLTKNEETEIYPRILPVGETAFTVEFGNAIDLALNRKVHALDAALNAPSAPWLVETVPTYRSLLVIYDPLKADAQTVRTSLQHAIGNLRTVDIQEGPVVEIPVRYGGTYGPDLKDIAAHCGISPQEVIHLHTQPIYHVAMLGFAPGFTYLLGLPPQLATPRLPTPRLHVHAGSVGIAGEQTGIYAMDTPGGWRIIGRTELALFDPHRDAPFLLHAGDRVRFIPSPL